MSIYIRPKIDISTRAGNAGLIEGELLTHYEYTTKYRMTRYDLQYFDLVDTQKNNIYTMFGVRQSIHKEKLRVLPDDEKVKWYENPKATIR